MAFTLTALGRSLTTLDVAELVMLPRFTAADAADWPLVLNRRRGTVDCAVAGDHSAELSVTIGHPHTGEPQRWLDLCRPHAQEIEAQFGYSVAGAHDDGAVAGLGDGAVVEEHPFATTLREAVGAGADGDGGDRVAVLGALPGPCDAVAFLPDVTLVAADVSDDWVRAQLAGSGSGSALGSASGTARFVAALAARLGGPATFAELLTVAPHRAPMLRGGVTVSAEPGAGWASYRTDVRSYRYRSSGVEGLVDVGRGPGGRVDVYPQVETVQGRGGASGRELVAAALSLAPEGRPVFGTAPLHDVRSLQTLLEGGFSTLGTEVLFLTRPPERT